MNDLKENNDRNITNSIVSDVITIATVGDIILTVDFIEKMESHPECLELINILKHLLVVGNYEGTIIDPDDFESYPDALSGFGWLATEPSAVEGLTSLGLKMLSRANNHATDWGREGMYMTNAYLEEEGFVHAGTGDSRLASREPCYYSENDIDYSLISWTTEITADSTASNSLFSVEARPGVSSLHRHTYIRVGSNAYNLVKQVAAATGVSPSIGELEINGYKLINIANSVVELDYGLSPDQIVIENKLDQIDVEEIKEGIQEARANSDFVIAAQHHHGLYNNTTNVDNDIQEFCREVIDEGVDLIFGHGPHRLRGIEIYKGKPIFYSLGNFFFTDNTQQFLTWDEWERYLWRVLNNHLPSSERIDLDPYQTSVEDFLEWKRLMVFPSDLNFKSVIAISIFNRIGNKNILSFILLIPIELFFEEVNGTKEWRGIPRVADAETADKILEYLQNASNEFNTDIDIISLNIRNKPRKVGLIFQDDRSDIRDSALELIKDLFK
ncbi:CapA family protein [Acinetobacter rudis]|uniref:Capsule synthesis protein CapA domain-containing protein n=1 Tax=Acinetobacter rudis CIP 110305 TaxID=421052 RepID=S3PEW5_9GAMM|nr:CapA family protein [Acinetobacter rudis]EPF77351.1 hypothetical protein F945_01017 [Acinetobacter rudis CIP 110305]